MIIKQSKQVKVENIHALCKYLEYGAPKLREQVQAAGLDADALKAGRVKFSFTGNLQADELNKQAIQEMELTADANRRAKGNRFLHLIVSLRQDENLERDQWQHIARRAAGKLGLEEHQYFGVVHKDTDNEHLHLIINLISPQTYKINTLAYSHRKLQELAADLEQELQLKQDNHQTVKNEAQRSAETVERTTAQQAFYSYAAQYTAQLQAAQSWQELHALLQLHGMKLKRKGPGLVLYTVFAGKEYAVKASALDRELSFSQLTARLGPYTAALPTDIEPVSVFTAQPVTADPDGQQTKRYQAFLEQKRLHKAERSAELTKAESQKQQALSALKEQRTAARELLAQIRRSDPQRAADEQAKMSQLFAAKAKAIKHEYAAARKAEISKTAEQSYLDYLKDVNEEYEGALRRELLQRLQRTPHRGNILTGAISMRVTVKRLTYFQLVKRTGKGQDLYLSQYAHGEQIRDDLTQIKISRNPSFITVLDAFTLAKQRFADGTITVEGAAQYQRLCAVAAAQLGIKIRCSDPAVQNFYITKKEQQHGKLRNFSKPVKPIRSRRERFAGSAAFRAEPFSRDYEYAFKLTEPGQRTEYERGEQLQQTSGQTARQSADGENNLTYPYQADHQRRAGGPLAARKLHLHAVPGSSMAAGRQNGDVSVHPAASAVMEQSKQPDVLQGVRRAAAGEGAAREGSAGRGLDALQNYLAERNVKRALGLAVLEHRLWQQESGTFTYRGQRKLGGKVYALLEKDQIIYVRAIEDYAQRRLKQRGMKVFISKHGRLEVVNSKKRKR